MRHLRILIGNEKSKRLELIGQVVAGRGHDVFAREIYVKEVGPVTVRKHPDVALVGLGSSSERALALISEIVRDASRPVISILHAATPPPSARPRNEECFAYIIDGTPDELQIAIDITLQRSNKYRTSKDLRTPRPDRAKAS